MKNIEERLTTKRLNEFMNKINSFNEKMKSKVRRIDTQYWIDIKTGEKIYHYDAIGNGKPIIRLESNSRLDYLLRDMLDNIGINSVLKDKEYNKKEIWLDYGKNYQELNL